MKKCAYLLTRIEHNAPDNSKVHTARNLLHATLLKPRVWGLLPDFWQICESLHMIILKFWHVKTKWPRECGWGSLICDSTFFAVEVILAFGVWTVWQWAVLPTFWTNILFAIGRNDVCTMKPPYQIAVLFPFRPHRSYWQRKNCFTPSHGYASDPEDGGITVSRTVSNIAHFCAVHKQQNKITKNN